MSQSNKPVLNFLDIETSPLIGYSWATFDTSILRIIESSKVISIAWKELHDKDVTVKCIADYEDYLPGVVNDESLIRDIWKLLDGSDIVCAHHGDNFDLKKLNARFAFYGLNSPSPYRSIDTKKAASRYFKFDSNSLNNLGAYLNVGQKINNGGFDLWVRCMAGDSSAWEEMKVYNAQDVLLLEQVYLKLRPFIANHPDLNAINPTTSTVASCGTCQSSNVTKRGFSLTKLGRKQRYQCTDCGSWSVGSWERSSTAAGEALERNKVVDGEEDEN